MAASVYENFDLQISPAAGSYQARVIFSPTGEAAGEFSAPFTEADLRVFLRRFDPAASGSAPDRTATPQATGERLYRAVFAGPVGACLLRSLDEAARRGAGVRIRLRLDRAAPELADWPWEYLHAPGRPDPFALSTDTPIVRYIELAEPVKPLRANLPLRVLVVAASPRDLPALEIEQEWARLEAALAPLVRQGLIEIERLIPATAAALQARLRGAPAHLLHFIGHGGFDPNADVGGLFFEDEAGGPAFTPAADLGMLLHDHPSLRLMFLNACESGRGGRRDPFAGVAQRLVQAGAPAVVAMQFPVTDAAAAILSQEFYRALADGLPADAALNEARKAIKLAGNAFEWGTPVLFSRSSDNQLIDLAPADRRPGVAVAPPPEPMQPPGVAGFVGRTQELAAFAASLATDHVAVIAGMAGIGKTALAAQLAGQVAASPDRIFWHQFHAGEGIETIIWRLAGMLWRHGQRPLWELLEGARQSGGQPPRTELLLDYLAQLLRGQNYVLCLDDFHHAEEDPLVEKALDRLQTLLAAGEIKLIVTSRRMPTALRTLAFAPLGGLSQADAADLLAARKVTLAADLLAELHQRTDGNAELLSLAAQALRRSRQPAQVVKRLADEEDIETFLLKEVDKGLAEDEKRALSGVAALLGYPGTRDAIEATLASGSLKRTLRYLANRFLLREQEGRLDHEYLTHAIVQAFYYELLSRKERQELHRRAGEYYEREEPDRVRAALHYQRAGEGVRAAELVTADVWGALHQGQTLAQQQILAQFTPSQVPPPLWVQIQLRLGEIHQHFRRSPQARSAYEQALSTLDAGLDSPAVRGQKALVCRRLGGLLGYEAPAEAMAWTERGLEIAGESQREERAALLVQKGALHVLLAEFDAAEAAVGQGLALVEGQVNQVTVDGLTNLAAIYSTRGDIARGRAAAERGLALAHQLHDAFRALKLSVSLGVDRYDAGDRAGGIADTRQALALAEQLGAVTEQAMITLNLGDMLREEGDLAAAAHYTAESLRLAQQGRLHRLEVAASTNLAHLALARGDAEAALDHLAAAEALARQLEADDALPEILTARAEALLAHGDPATARACAEQAVALAEALGMEGERDAARRALNEASTALEQA
jgi:hypothetical protein